MSKMDAKMCRKGAEALKMVRNGARREQKGAKKEPKGAKREPKGSKVSQKGGKGSPKYIQKSSRALGSILDASGGAKKVSRLTIARTILGPKTS